MWLHRYEIGLVLDVREIGMDGIGRAGALFKPYRLRTRGYAPFEPTGDILHEEATFRLRGRFVDHDVPCLSFLIEERRG